MNILNDFQAQELANLLGCFVHASSTGAVWACSRRPRANLLSGAWDLAGATSSLFIKIESEKPWYEQIWEPNGYTDIQ